MMPLLVRQFSLPHQLHTLAVLIKTTALKCMISTSMLLLFAVGLEARLLRLTVLEIVRKDIIAVSQLESRLEQPFAHVRPSLSSQQPFFRCANTHH